MKRHEREFQKQRPTGEFWEKPRTRRSALRQFVGGAALIAATGAAGDTLSGEFYWGGTTPEIHAIDNPEAKEKFPDTFTIAIGGFNVANTKGLGHDVEKILPDFGQTAYLKYSNDGLDLDDIERETLAFIEKNNVHRLRFYGHSMGGMVAMELARRVQHTVGSLEAIILDCTPAGYEDVRPGARTGVDILDKTNKPWTHFGPYTRTAVETITPIIEGKKSIFTIFDVCKSALSKLSTDMCSNKLLQGQGTFLKEFRPEDYRDCFSKSTHIIRLRPHDYGADPTINNYTSYPRWCAGLNRDIIDVPVRGGGHANPGACQEQYGISLRNTAKRLAFYDGSPVRSSVRPI